MRATTRRFLALLAICAAAFAALASSALAKPNEIAYRCDEIDICLLDPETPSAITNLTDNGSKTYDQEPVWSPDGTRVAFVSWEPAVGARNIFVMRPDAPDQGFNIATQLTHYGYEGASIRNLVWSPDGTKVAYQRELGGGRNVYVVAADGSTLTPLTIAEEGQHPSWAPDGGKIAYSKGEQIYTTNADGSNAIAPLPGGKGRDPVWAPNGSSIAFDTPSPMGFNTFDTGILSYPGGGTPLALPAQQPDGTYPTWSPDGGRIAYRVRNGGSDDVIHIANANGSGDIPLPGLENTRVYNYPPSWSPGGGRLVFEGFSYPPKTQGFDLYFVTTTGAGPVLPFTAGGKNYEPDWRPDPLVTPFVPVVTPSGGKAGTPPGGRKPKLVWFTKRAPITPGGPIHVMIVFCGAPDCGASSVGKVPSASVPAGLRFRPASASKKKKKPKALVVSAGKLSLAQDQEKTLDMYLNKAGKALLKKRGKLNIKTTVTITSSGQDPVTSTRTIHVDLAKPKPKPKR